MNARVFIDTCVLVYAFVKGESRQAKALSVMAEGGSISVQVLNEFANACRKKLRMDWKETGNALGAVRALCSTPIPLTLKTHSEGLGIAQNYGFSVYDGMIVAAAIGAGCTTLYSEDLQHGQMIEGLRVENPFNAASS
jgi:predicted nucleic acid-binding protein